MQRHSHIYIYIYMLLHFISPHSLTVAADRWMVCDRQKQPDWNHSLACPAKSVDWYEKLRPPERDPLPSPRHRERFQLGICRRNCICRHPCGQGSRIRRRSAVFFFSRRACAFEWTHTPHTHTNTRSGHSRPSRLYISIYSHNRGMSATEATGVSHTRMTQVQKYKYWRSCWYKSTKTVDATEVSHTRVPHMQQMKEKSELQ